MPLTLCLLLGALLPVFHATLPATAWAGAVFLFGAALELDLRDFKRERRLVSRLAGGAFFLPFFAGLALALTFPGLFPSPAGVSRLTTAAVVAIALSVSAVPVILKILQEVGLLGTVLGRRIVLAATFCDLAAWLLFLPLLPLSGQGSWISSHLTLLAFFAGLLVTYFRPGILKRHPWFQKFNSWVAAPLFFVGVGESLDFSKGLNWGQLAAVLAVASLSKIVGVMTLSRGLGMSERDRRTAAIALNCRGAMEILMASLALKAGLLGHDLFVSLIAMALGTTVLIKPLLKLERWADYAAFFIPTSKEKSLHGVK